MSELKVLVTGAGGFIGSHLVKRLQERGDCRITCLFSNRRKSNPPPAREGCSYQYGDINDPDAVAQSVANQDVVVHLAGRVLNQSGTMTKVNVDGTRIVLEKCAELGNPPITILTSSLAAAGPNTGQQLQTEFDPALPVSLYGRSKRAAELLGYQFADRVPISVLRPPIVFGPQDPVSFLLFRPISRFGIHVIPGGKDLRISMIHCDDLVSAILKVIESGRRLESPNNGEPKSPRGLYFVAAKETPKYSELGRMIGEVVGRDHVRMLHPPLWLVSLTGVISESSVLVTGKMPVVNRDKAKEITAGEWACSCEHLARDTQFYPEYKLEERLAQTADWYFENGWLKKPHEFVPATMRVK